MRPCETLTCRVFGGTAASQARRLVASAAICSSVRRVLGLLRVTERDLVIEIPSRVDRNWTTLADVAH